MQAIRLVVCGHHTIQNMREASCEYQKPSDDVCMNPPNTSHHRRQCRQGIHLLEILLGLLHAGNVVKGDAGVGLHLELGLGLAHLHGVVATAKAARAAGAAAAPRQQEQAAHEQQRECQVSCCNEVVSSNSQHFRIVWAGITLVGWRGLGEDARKFARSTRQLGYPNSRRKAKRTAETLDDLGQTFTEQVEEDGAAVLGVGVRSEVDLLVAELAEQLGAGAGQLHPHTLDAVPELRADCLHDGNRAILVQVNLQSDAP